MAHELCRAPASFARVAFGLRGKPVGMPGDSWGQLGLHTPFGQIARAQEIPYQEPIGERSYARSIGGGHNGALKSRRVGDSIVASPIR